MSALMTLAAYGGHAFNAFLTPNPEIIHFTVSYKNPGQTWHNNNIIDKEYHCKYEIYRSRKYKNITILLNKDFNGLKCDYFKTNIYLKDVNLNNNGNILNSSILQNQIDINREKNIIKKENNKYVEYCYEQDLNKEIKKQINKTNLNIHQNYSKQIKNSVKIRNR